MRPPRRRTLPIAAGAFIASLAACRPAPPSPAPVAFIPAASDSCARAQLRAEQQPVFRVMHEAIPERANTPPAYPLRERHARFKQEVTVRFIVSPDGRVDTTSVDFVSTSGPAFAREVLAVLPTWRFRPAELVPGCRVPFRVTMPIVFHEPAGRSAS